MVLSLALMVVINNVGVKICYEKNREREFVFHACVLRETLFKKILNNLVYSPN